MTDARVLLDRYKPRLVYDSMEAYFADSAAIWTDSATNVLRRPDGTILARPPQLSLQLLGPHTYSDGRPVLADDAIGDTTRDYAGHAAAMHGQARYRNRVYGHARRDGQGRLWLQYWLFYYYNDFQLFGPLASGGKHEGDWELVQFRLGPSEQPEQAVYSQHKTAESRAWADVRKQAGNPNMPAVYIARGSHANYFARGSHWTGTWYDQADGAGPSLTPTLEILEDAQPGWVIWPGFWGDTKATPSPLDSSSPRGPGVRPHWLDPSLLVSAPKGLAARPAPVEPSRPRISARRKGDRAVIDYEFEGSPRPLVVGLRPKGTKEPARTRSFDVDRRRGEVELPIDGRAYDVWASAGGSAAAKAAVGPG